MSWASAKPWIARPIRFRLAPPRTIRSASVCGSSVAAVFGRAAAGASACGRGAGFDVGADLASTATPAAEAPIASMAADARVSFVMSMLLETSRESARIDAGTAPAAEPAVVFIAIWTAEAASRGGIAEALLGLAAEAIVVAENTRPRHTRRPRSRCLARESRALIVRRGMIQSAACLLMGQALQVAEDHGRPLSLGELRDFVVQRPSISSGLIAGGSPRL